MFVLSGMYLIQIINICKFTFISKINCGCGVVLLCSIQNVLQSCTIEPMDKSKLTLKIFVLYLTCKLFYSKGYCYKISS